MFNGYLDLFFVELPIQIFCSFFSLLDSLSFSCQFILVC